MDTMQTNPVQNDAVEIDLGELFRELLNNFLIILLATFIGAMVGYLIGKTVITPEYTSTTKIYVTANDDTQQSSKVDTGELQAGALLTKDYQQIIESREVTEAVIARLQLTMEGEALTHQELLDKISVDIPSDTRVVGISVTDSDPYVACDIANAVRDVAMERIQNVMDMKSVKIVEDANVPVKPSTTSASKIGIIGAAIGFLLAAACVILRYMTNNTITTSEDVDKYLGLSILGTIPAVELENKKKIRRDVVQRKNKGDSKR